MGTRVICPTITGPRSTNCPSVPRRIDQGLRPSAYREPWVWPTHLLLRGAARVHAGPPSKDKGKARCDLRPGPPSEGPAFAGGGAGFYPHPCLGWVHLLGEPRGQGRAGLASLGAKEPAGPPKGWPGAKATAALEVKARL